MFFCLLFLFELFERGSFSSRFFRTSRTFSRFVRVVLFLFIFVVVLVDCMFDFVVVFFVLLCFYFFVFVLCL